MSEYPGPEDWNTYMWVVAHPDDLEFSSAGTVKRLTNAGKKCILVQVTSGDRGTGDRSYTPDTLMSTREQEVHESAKRLGLAEVAFLHEGDGHVEPNIALREKIVKQIRIHKPDVVITHDPFRPYAMHPDHRGVGLATHDSVYPTARDHLYFPEHLAEGIEPHKTAEIWYFGAESPDVFIDITDTFDNKIDALRAHDSQVGMREDLVERLRERSAEIAKDQPFELAEAYKSIRMNR